ncbi:MAG: holo-ACP synthase [Gammaproteobacteria bacterium]|nr:MAG: holo-ACP synthase [Gammaproteobacteria bacterium]
MIFGIGTDIVKVDRMQKNLDKYGDRFASKILTETEMKDYNCYRKKAHFLAKRFAAKEAAAKAMGLGFRNGLQLKHIGVDHDKLGKPMLEFSGFASRFVQDKKITSVHLSLSDEVDHAVAFVTLEAGS